MSTVLALYNPVSGDSSGKAFFEVTVLPHLEEKKITVSKVVSTEKIGHAGHLVVEFLESTEGPVTIILGGGDGTLHEIINTLSATELKGSRAGAPPSRLHFALVPCGTANALYSSYFSPKDKDITSSEYRLQSVDSFIQGKATVALTLSISSISAPPSKREQPTTVIGSVVVSTALHAAILRDSESLRATMPGIERFKVAANQNISNWYEASVKLLPAPGHGTVQIYDPSTKAFMDHEDSDLDDPIVDLEGPFAYFLSTSNVDRLEPAFTIAPLMRRIAPTEPCFDLIMVRPFNDPTSTEMNTPEAREAFSAKIMEALGAAYKEGSHINLRYDINGGITAEGEGPLVVEYVRIGAFEWSPDELDEGAHLLCSDGAISVIKPGGRVVCSAAGPSQTAGFMMHI